MVMVFDLNGFKTYNDTFGAIRPETALLAQMGSKLA